VDIAARAAIHRLLNEAASDGLALLVCSGEMEDELVELCDRVLVMRDGRVAAELAGNALSRGRIAREALTVGVGGGLS
jgi:ABC-type sugar transport system ATPase subunit